jgi:hypothetical protein
MHHDVGTILYVEPDKCVFGVHRDVLVYMLPCEKHKLTLDQYQCKNHFAGYFLHAVLWPFCEHLDNDTPLKHAVL